MKEKKEKQMEYSEKSGDSESSVCEVNIETKNKLIINEELNSLGFSNNNSANNKLYSDSSICEHSCGGMNYTCEFCLALNFRDEKLRDNTFKHCCSKNTVLLPRKQYPECLQNLLTNVDNQNYQDFRKNIRNYNSAVAFASFSAKEELFSTKGPPVIRIHGQIYHRASHLHPNDENKRRFAQLYIMDSRTANQERIKQCMQFKLDQQILDILDNFLRRNNPFCKAYRMLNEVVEDCESSALYGRQKIQNVNMIFKKDRSYSQKRYTIPTVDEVAAVFKSESGEPPFERDFKVYPRARYPNEKLIILNVTSPNLLPMVYPLLFPYGEPGWSPNLKINVLNKSNRKRTRITMLQWAMANLTIRENEFNAALHAGELIY